MKFTHHHYEDADEAARTDAENREPQSLEEPEARLAIDEITDETGSGVRDLLEGD